MTLLESINAINAMPLGDAQKAAVIAQLMLAAPAQPVAVAVDPAVLVKQQQDANLAALRNTGGAASFVPGAGGAAAAQSATAQAQASQYVVQDPTPADAQNPPLYAYRQFVAAGFTNVTAPNGPVDRFGAEMAMHGNDPAQFKAAVQKVIDTYQAGTANMQTHFDEASSFKSINAGNYTPANYTDEQKMAMQYIAVGGPGSQKANVWLDLQLGGNGKDQNLKANALAQMFGSSGTATLYNPLAGGAMNALIAGKTADFVLSTLTAEGGPNPVGGYAESLAALTPAWFTQALATIAQFK